MKLTSDIPVSSPFIFTDKGDGLLSLRSNRDSILRLSAVALNYHRFHATQPNQPLQFSAGHTMAPELISACWLAGVPYWVTPEHESESLVNDATKLINPVAYKWQDAIQLYLKENGSNFNHGQLPADIPDDSYFCYIFTSGSTGAPKLVGLKRSQMLAAAQNAAKNGRPETSESWLLCLPLNHIGGASVILRSWIYGNSVVDARESTTEMLSAQLRTNESLTYASVVPTQLIRLIEFTNDNPVHEGFKVMLLGGGPSTPQIIESARKRGVPVVKSYGMTETCAQIAAVPVSESGNFPANSSGKLFAGHQISVRDDEGREVARGERGIIWLKGPQVITSYVHHPKPEAAFDSDGWFCTGDFGYVNQDSWLFIEMRRSDLIVSGGENINPLEIEAFIRDSFPHVSDVAVAGLPDEFWGQKMVAWIVAEPKDSLTANDFINKMKAVLPAFKVPREVRIVSKLPRNSMGKLLRSELKNLG